MKRLSMIVTAALAMLAMAGCSKPAPEDTLPPPKAPTAKAMDFPAPTNLPSAPQAVKVAPVAPEAPATPPEDSPEALSGQVKQFEADYKNTDDFQKRVVIIYNLSSVESPDTVDAIGRLFLDEKDKELKIELVNSLLDIDGENDKKLAILSGAIRGDQPKDVRLQGIDGMGDTEDKRSIQVLQGLLIDPDEDIRENAQDTIDQLQTDVMPPQPAAQTPIPVAK
jgi:HEAT repeat protein